jgi:4-hydroxybenzoate polyprenyltransferase
MHWLAYAIGAFYLLAGVIIIRAGRMNRMLDDAISQIGGTPTPFGERVRGIYAFVVGALTLVSGGALIALSRWAVPAFLVCSLVQAAYLVWAIRALPPGDAEESKGRRASMNAFIIYAAATAFVVWLDYTGVLR